MSASEPTAGSRSLALGSGTVIMRYRATRDIPCHMRCHKDAYLTVLQGILINASGPWGHDVIRFITSRERRFDAVATVLGCDNGGCNNGCGCSVICCNVACGSLSLGTLSDARLPVENGFAALAGLSPACEHCTAVAALAARLSRASSRSCFPPRSA